MMMIKCELPISAWVWSREYDFSLPVIDFDFNDKIHVKVIIDGDLSTVDEANLPNDHSYRVVKSIKYVISNSSSRQYPADLGFDELTKNLGEDIKKVHNRVIAVLRGRLQVWQLFPVETPKKFNNLLPIWNVEYRKGTRGKYAKYKSPHKGGLLGFLETLESSPAPLSAHLNIAGMDEVVEWLEERKPITVTDELLTQAEEAAKKENLRLAIFNYIGALEQILIEFLSKKLRKKLTRQVTQNNIDEFLGSTNTRLEDKLRIVLPLVMHESWIKDIDFVKIKLAISARNKIAHGLILEVTDAFPGVEWQEIFRNIKKLIASLRSSILLVDGSAEIKQISDEIQNELSVYPALWIQRAHRFVAEIVLYAGDPRDEAYLTSIAEALATKRTQQDSRFVANKHLVVTFYTYPKVEYAVWKSGEIKILNDNEANS